jgi:hypothetical protein
MSQHDYNIANGGGAAVRADINNALLAILSQNSGATAPTTTKPFMLWYDTANALIKMRNAADTGWIDYMNSSGQLVAPTATGLITALGGQIKFPGTQNASSDANTLDDYEEGTWTPTLTGATFTYSVQAGRYLKIGSFVLVQAVIATGYASATGAFYISNLPFTVVNDSNIRGGVAVVNCQYGVTFNNYVTGEPVNNSTNMYFENNYSGNNRVDMGSSNFASGGFAVRVNMTYQVA